jgi:uncharacterized membrane protein
MGIAVALIAVAIGAVLEFAVTSTNGTIDVNVVGEILLIVGMVGFLVALGFEINRRRPLTQTRTAQVDRGAGYDYGRGDTPYEDPAYRPQASERTQIIRDDYR